MTNSKEYGLNLKWAGNLQANVDMFIVEIPAFGTFAQVHGGNRGVAVTLAEQSFEALSAAYQGQGLTLPPGDAGV